MSMYYVTEPNEAVRLIQILVRKNNNQSFPKKIDTENDEKIGAREVSYDTKETVRDVLR